MDVAISNQRSYKIQESFIMQKDIINSIWQKILVDIVIYKVLVLTVQLTQQRNGEIFDSVVNI